MFSRPMLARLARRGFRLIHRPFLLLWIRGLESNQHSWVQGPVSSR